MTERLYYTDPYLVEFDADVLDVRDVDGRPGVVLDRSAFYPTSGGQPFDTGVIGGARVVDVIDLADGTIVHVIAGDPPSGRVSGRVSWDRRFEHMQQHTGQHVLSGAFDRLHGVRTLSFHLGSTASTIDLAREVAPHEIAGAEDAANQVVWEDRSVTIRFVEAGEAASLPLRKETARAGRLRIVEVEGFDVSACGGTHVSRTGAIGVVAVSAWERFKGGTRLEFRCGVRALRAHRHLRDTVAAGIRLLSVAADELPLGVERLQAENRDAKRRIRTLEERLAAHEARAIAQDAEDVHGLRLVVAAVADLDLPAVKSVAQVIAARPAHLAVLLTDAAPASVVVARAADVTVDAAGLLKTLMAAFGGKGGGRPDLAQGGGLAAGPAEIRAAVRSALG